MVVHREHGFCQLRQHQLNQSVRATAAFRSLPLLSRAAGRIVEMAILLNLPAVFLGGILDSVVGAHHFPTGEQSLLEISVVFVPVIWYYVGKWLDNRFTPEKQHQSTQITLKAVCRILARAIVWFLFVMTFLAFLFERHRYPGSTNFMMVALILWAGVYLAGGLWGDHQRSARRRVVIESPALYESVAESTGKSRSSSR
jgi:L-asparagine transporter-like permease